MFGTTGTGTLEHVWIGYGGSDGNLTANGALVNLRYAFVGYSATNGLRWMAGGRGEIADSIIEQNLSYGLYLSGSSYPTVSGNTFAHNRSYAVYMEGNCQADFSGNEAYGNTYNGIGVYGTVATSTWHANLPYLATASLAVESGSTLTLEPGTVVKFLSQKALIIRGALAASGTEAQPIVLTTIKDDEYGGDTQQDGAATKPGRGDWGTLYFADTTNDATTVLDHVIVRYGGYGYSYGSGTSYANVTLDSAGPRIVNSRFEYSGKYGLQLVNASLPQIDSNLIWENADAGLWLGPSSSPQVPRMNLT